MKLLRLIWLMMLFGLQGCSLLPASNSTDTQALPVAKAEDSAKLSEPLFCTEAGKETTRLLKQGAYYAQLEAEPRHAACQKLMTLYQAKGQWQVGWLLAYSFSDHPSCLSHKQRLQLLQTLEESAALNGYLQWLNQAKLQTLRQIDVLKRQSDGHEKTANDLKLENQRLQAQIQALKSIEKTLNERMDNDSGIAR